MYIKPARTSKCKLTTTFTLRLDVFNVMINRLEVQRRSV